MTNAFPVTAASNSSDSPAIAAKQTKQMPPLPANKLSQLPKLKDGATPPVGSPTAPPPLPGSMKVTPPTAIPVVRAVPDVAKIESVKLRAEGTAPVTKETIAANARVGSEPVTKESVSASAQAANEPAARASVAAKARAESETTDIEAESFDEKTVDVQNKLTAVVELTSAQAKRRPATDAKSLAERSAKPAFDLAPVLSSTLETGPIARVGLETGPIPRATLDSAQSSFDIAPITSSTLETGPIRRPTLESGPIVAPLAAKSTAESVPLAVMSTSEAKPVEKKVINPGSPKAQAPEETRTPGSSFVLPANPLMNLTDASLEGFIDCALYEETGNFYRAEDPGLVDVGDLVQPPLPNQLSPIQALRPGDVSDRQPSYIGPMPHQHSYMGQMPTGGTYPPPYSTQPPYSTPTGQMAPLRGSSTTPMPLDPNDVNVAFGQNANGLSPTAFNARRAQSEVFAPEQTPIPMLLGPGYAQQLENAARDAASTTPPPFGPPETRTNWERAQTPDPSRDTPLSYARVEMNPQARIDTQPLILLPDGTAQPSRPSTITQAQFGRPETATQQVEMDMQRSTGQTPPLPRDYNSSGFSPQRGGRFATGQFPPQPLSSSAPEVAPGTHPLVGPGALPSEPYPQPSYPQQYPQQQYGQQQYGQQQYGQQQYAPPNPAMHAASLPSTPLTPRPRRERTQITSAVNPRRWMVIAGSAAVATAAIVTIVMLATRGDKKSAVAATAPTTKLTTSGTQKIDSNVARPTIDTNAGAAAVKPTESKSETKATETKPTAPTISTSNDATVAHTETKVAPKEKPEQPKTDDGEDTSESDAPPVVGSGPCRMEIATTPAGSIVKVDDHAIGPSPVTVAGACKKTKIEVNHARYAAATKWVSPTEGTPANVDVQLSRPTHAVTVTSSPAGATVSIGGRRAGTTPTSVSLMGFTTLTLTFEKKGYGTVTQRFYSKKDNDRVTVTMKKGK